MTMRRATARAAERLGIERHALSVWERARTLRALPEMIRGERLRDRSGLPLPPPHLRLKVTGFVDADEFLDQGARAAATIRSALEANSTSIEAVESILDFGCGCGRVTRHWAHVPGRVTGSDYNPHLVGWCHANLAFGTFSVNQSRPPLAFEDGSFDLVYAISIFTHFTRALQREWMTELGRVLRPGGWLLFSTRSEAWADSLDAEERRRFDTGKPVERYTNAAGTNLCAAFHPLPFVVGELASAFDHRSTMPAALDGRQDLHVFRKPKA